MDNINLIKILSNNNLKGITKNNNKADSKTKFKELLLENSKSSGDNKNINNTNNSDEISLEDIKNSEIYNIIKNIMLGVSMDNQQRNYVDYSNSNKNVDILKESEIDLENLGDIKINRPLINIDIDDKGVYNFKYNNSNKCNYYEKISQINENYNVIPSNNIDTIKTTDYIINGNDMSTENEKIRKYEINIGNNIISISVEKDQCNNKVILEYNNEQYKNTIISDNKFSSETLIKNILDTAIYDIKTDSEITIDITNKITENNIINKNSILYENLSDSSNNDKIKILENIINNSPIDKQLSKSEKFFKCNSKNNTNKEKNYSEGLNKNINLNGNINSNENITENIYDIKKIYNKDFQDNIVKTFKIINSNENVKELKMKIKPEKLGELTIVLESKNGELNGQIKAGTLEAYELINSNINKLKEELQQQGITLNNLETALNNDSNNQSNSNTNKSSKNKNLNKKNSLNKEDIKIEMKNSIIENKLDLLI